VFEALLRFAFGEDFVGRLGPPEGFAPLVPAFDEHLDGLVISMMLVKEPRRMA